MAFACSGEPVEYWKPSDVATPLIMGETVGGLAAGSLQPACLDSVLMSVQCCADAATDCANARVIGLGLSGQQLRGSLPDAIGRLGALNSLKLHDNFLTGTFPQSLGRLHWLRELQLSHNQFEMQARDSLSEILGGMLYLSTLDLSMSDEKEDLDKSVIRPAPPLDCRVGEPCEFMLSTRTRLGLSLPHGGLSVAVQTGSSPHVNTQLCADQINGSYACTLPSAWVAAEGEFDFVLLADSQEFEPIRTLVDPTTGTSSTVATYSSLMVMVAAIQCHEDHSYPKHADGSECVCEEGYYRREIGGGGWSCERCGGGFEPASEGTRCEACAFGKYSPDGERCQLCDPGYEPNAQTSADSCQVCDESSTSPAGVQCSNCPPDQQADASRTACVCPINMYNSSLRGGKLVRCIPQGLHGDDQTAPAVCVACGDLECVECGASGLAIRADFAIAQTDQTPWLVFSCPFEGACEPDQMCKTGTTGLLCAVCEAGYGLDQHNCVECSATNSNPYTAAALLATVCVLVALVYLWRRRNRAAGRVDHIDLTEGLTANPLQDSPESIRASASSGKVAAVAQKTTNLYTLTRVVYQPVRIIVGYIQVVTQIGPVLDLQFPQYIKAVLDALKPFMIDLQSILQLDCLSSGLLDFYATWVVRVFVIPALMLGVVGLQYYFERKRVGASAAAGIFKANAFVVVFLCYPGVCNHAFGMFECRKVGADLSVLVKDYSILCSTSKHSTFQAIAAVYIAAVAFGIPLRMGQLMFNRMREYGGGSASDRFVARRVADELKLSDTMAADAIRDCNTGREYSFLVNAYKPRYYFWEGYDMIRKLMLVGMLVVAGRGSVAQLFLALSISFVTFSLQVKLAPYRHSEDNLLKAAVEIHIFLLVAIALVLKSLRSGAGGEVIPEGAYDMLLIISFVIAIPGAFVWTVSQKKAMLEQALQEAAVTVADEQSAAARQRAIRLLQLGLTSNDDMRLLAAYFSELDAMVNKVSLEELAGAIEGRGALVKWDDVAPIAADTRVNFHWRPQQSPPASQARAAIERVQIQVHEQQPSEEPSAAAELAFDDPFAKFSGGFEGSFADTSTFHEGLVQLIGEPSRDVSEAVRAEHCDVLGGFGASKAEMTASNYGVTFSPEKEYRFVSDLNFLEPMSCGLEWKSKRSPIPGGFRHKLDIRELSNPKVAVARIRQSFKQMGWSETAVTETMYGSLMMTLIELIALRLYTGPMFCLYNGVLRSMSSGGIVLFGFDQHLIGASVVGRFTTTLHAINSGVIKIARLQPKCDVYRGMNGMKLPKAFVQEDIFGVRCGVEVGFMSTTRDRSVAERYSKGMDADKPSLILEMKMGMVSRGAFLGWLSQYPDEAEILLPPLTGLEVGSYVEKADGTLVYTMHLNINLKSMTIEQVIAARQTQCLELADVVGRDLALHVAVGDVAHRQAAAEQQRAAIKADDPNAFNDNDKFVQATEALLGQLPRRGDLLKVFQHHDQPVFALVAPGSSMHADGPCVTSGSWDGTIATVSENANGVGHQMGSPVLSLSLMEDRGLVAVGMQNRSVVLSGLGAGGDEEPVLLTGHSGPVTSLAWLPDQQWLACGSIGVMVWIIGRDEDGLHLPEPRWHFAKEGEGPVRGLCWASVGAGHFWLALGSGTGNTRMWELGNSTQPEEVMTLAGHAGAVTAVASLRAEHDHDHDQDELLLATGSTDCSIAVWSLPRGEQVARVRGCHRHAICALVTIGDSQLASGSADTTIKLWQLHSSHRELVLLATMEGHNGPVHALVCLEPQGWLASGGTDGSVRLWRVGQRRIGASLLK